MIRALLIAPGGAVAVVVAWSIIVGPVNPSDSRLYGAFVIAIVTALYAYPAVLLGIPLLYIFWRNGVQKWLWYWLAGGVVGLVYGLILAAGGLLSFPESTKEFLEFLFYSLCGLSSSALFHAIYRPTEP